MTDTFEFDQAKSASNKDKHGIDFVEAQKLWSDPDAWIRLTMYVEEPRFLITGLRFGKYWTAVFTPRAGIVRLISARRARQSEIRDYERNKIKYDEGS